MKGDFNGDGSIDLSDLPDLAGCFSGPCLEAPCRPELYEDLGCIAGDFEGDGDVDWVDVQGFLRTWRGK